jgi:predicted amidohydrolase YtcJ
LQWAIDGLSVDGKPTRQKPHLLDREEALTAYTQGSAWFSHEENERGRLAVGQRADLALLNDSYLKIETSRIHTLSADMTWVSGLLVHDATGRPSHTIKEKP